MLDKLQKFCPKVDWRQGKYGIVKGVLSTDPHVEIHISEDISDDEMTAELLLGVQSHTGKPLLQRLLCVQDRTYGPTPLHILQMLWGEMRALNIALGGCLPLEDWRPASDPKEWEILSPWGP